MKTADISDRQVCEAFRDAKAVKFDARLNRLYPYHLLMERTGAPFKVCYRAMERAERRGLVDCGVSLRTGWLTEKGMALLAEAKPVNTVFPSP